ncbi:MAG: ABC transporter permease [Erysipelotrichaceae bacterium]|nr:ABC transporter permease [Erysipelotrichaceae bacterium]MDY6035771.1 ABC transporter permease [Bulleidia sp.]
MGKYILKRALLALGIIFAISLITFFVLNVIPGDVVAAMLGEFASKDAIDAARHQLGLDASLPVQYFRWLVGLLTGNLGTSYFQRKAVLTLILQAFQYTFVMAIAAYIVAIVFGLLLGVIAAVQHDTWIDRILMSLSIFGISAPSFWVAILLQIFVGLRLGWFPVSGVRSAVWWVLPAFSLGIRSAASIARVTRTSMLEVLKQDYIKTALAKGVSYPRVIIFHAFRNALIPIMTILGNDFGALLTGSMITENVFNIPGIGKLLIDAINRRDIPLVQGGVIYVATICVLVYFIVDVLYALVNPNIRLAKEVN